MQNIVFHFKDRIRKVAAQDRLISTRGVSGYVQSVLAPELAVMLVKEDMGVDDQGARTILRDSAAVGHLLNEEEDEDIKEDEIDEQHGEVT